MSQQQMDRVGATPSRGSGLDITVRTGSGRGRTSLSAYDHALHRAGVADFNLVTLSSVIPAASRVRIVDADLPGSHGDVLFCVQARGFAEQPGDVAWAGLGWCVDASGAGLFVEHHGETEESVIEQIELSLGDMNRTRGGGYGPPQMAVASARCTAEPVCALVIAAYRVSGWHEEVPEPARASVAALTSDEDAPRATPPAVAARPIRPPAGRAGDSTRVSLHDVVDEATARRFYRLYRDAFGPLETEAVARQVLHESEFVEEMADPRVTKYVAWSEDGEAIGMSTLTSELESVPWISPAYFAHHYPEHHARDAVYYMGFTLVHPEHRGFRTYHAMFRAMSALLVAERAVVGWDMCLINDERGLGGDGARLLETFGDVTIVPIDRQTYFTCTFHGPPRDGASASTEVTDAR